jgi:hypothetical protein
MTRSHDRSWAGHTILLVPRGQCWGLGAGEQALSAKQCGEFCQAENGRVGSKPTPSSGEKLGFCNPVITMFSKDANFSLG